MKVSSIQSNQLLGNCSSHTATFPERGGARGSLGNQRSGNRILHQRQNGNGIENKATEPGGLLIGYRYSITRWLAAEANYGYDRNTQSYIGSTSGRVQSNIHRITGSAVVKLPRFASIQPYALAGGGGLIFDPTDNAGGTFAAATSEARGTFLYGGGADYAFTRHLFAARRISRFRVQITELQPGQPQDRRVDAYCAAVCWHSLSVLAELGTESKDFKRDWTTAGSGIGPEGNSANNPKPPFFID